MSSDPTELTEAEIADFNEAFSMFDRENTGSINTRDLEHILHTLGFTPTEQEMLDLITEVDANANGKIEFPEFLTVMSILLKDSGTEKDIREAFRVFDKEESGYISVPELRHIMTNLGEKLTNHEVDLLVKEADVKKEGRVNYEDFLTRLFYKPK